jgi:hypothetical protein
MERAFVIVARHGVELFNPRLASRIIFKHGITAFVDFSKLNFLKAS